MAYDPNRSLADNLQMAGLTGNSMGHGDLSPTFLSAIQTAFARAGASGYGGQQAFDLISRADPSRANADPLGYANELLQQSGVQGFSGSQDLISANTALPGHNEQSTPFNPMEVIQGGLDAAKSYASNQGALLPLAMAGGMAAFGPGAGGAAGSAATDAQLLSAAGITPTYSPAGFMTMGGTEAAAAGATPWLSNAPAGSVFSAGSAAPVAGAVGGLASALSNSGAPAAGGAAMSTAGSLAPAGTTALSRIMDGTASNADWLSVLGTAGATGLGIYGANQQADALRGIAEQGRADRAPFLGKSIEYLNDPDAYLAGPGKSSMDAVLRSLSVKGNPAGMPSSMALAGDYGLRSWQNAVTGLGNLGLAGEDTRANLMSQATGADANALNALGYGIGQVTNPPTSLEQLLRGMRGGSLSLV